MDLFAEAPMWNVTDLFFFIFSTGVEKIMLSQWCKASCEFLSSRQIKHLVSSWVNSSPAQISAERQQEDCGSADAKNCTEQLGSKRD